MMEATRLGNGNDGERAEFFAQRTLELRACRKIKRGHAVVKNEDVRFF